MLRESTRRLCYQGGVSSIAGKTALVTGGARRIGRDVTLGLAARGAHCLVHYNTSATDAADVVDGCRAAGVRAEAIAADLTDAASLRGLADRAADAGASILVHNASSFSRLPFLENAPDAHARMLARDLAVHVTAPYLLSRMLGERMVGAGWGRIVLFGDWTGEAAVYRNYGPYLVSKGAVSIMTKVLALELGARSPGVTVNAVLPGPIMAPEGHHPEQYEPVARQTILGRWVGSADVVRTVLFLLESDQITGISVPVDGGRRAKA